MFRNPLASDWAKAIWWDNQAKVRSMPQSKNPYRKEKPKHIGGADVFLKELEDDYRIKKLFGWTSYFWHYSEYLEQHIRKPFKHEERKQHDGWYRFKRDHAECAFFNLYKYSDMTINVRIIYVREEDRKKGLAKEICQQILFRLCNRVNSMFSKDEEYEGLLVGSKLQLLATANPLIFTKFPTEEQEEEWDWSLELNPENWGLEDESVGLLDGIHEEIPRFTQAELDALWEGVGFTPDESKKKFITIRKLGESEYESEDDFLMERSHEIGRYPKSYPAESSAECWPCDVPAKEPSDEQPD